MRRKEAIMLPKRAIFFLSLTMIFGCAAQRTIYRVDVSSFGTQRDVPPSSLVHVYVDPHDLDMMRKEFAGKLEFLLKKKGYRTGSLAEAEHVMFFTYGIDSEVETFTKYVYDPGVLPASKSKPASGSALEQFASGLAQGAEDAAKRMRPQQSQRKVHRRVLKLITLDAGALTRGETKVVSQVDVTSTGSSGDLRKVLNFMAVPAVEMFGTDSGRQVQFRVEGEDPRVIELMRSSKTK